MTIIVISAHIPLLLYIIIIITIILLIIIWIIIIIIVIIMSPSYWEKKIRIFKTKHERGRNFGTLENMR